MAASMATLLDGFSVEDVVVNTKDNPVVKATKTDRFVLLVNAGDMAEVVKRVKLGQDVNGKHSTLGFAAIHAAVDVGRRDYVDLLLKLGAHVNLRREGTHDTPLHVAVSVCDGKDVSMLHHLLGSGADPWLVNNRGQRPLELALEFQKEAAVKLLGRPPDVVSDVIISRIARRTMAIQWGLPEDHGVVVDSVDVEVKEWSKLPVTSASESALGRQKRFTVTRHMPATSAVVTGLFPGTHYVARLRARSMAGFSKWGPVFAFCTRASVPDRPINLRVVSNQGRVVRLGWDIPEVYASPLTVCAVQYMVSHVEDASLASVDMEAWDPHDAKLHAGLTAREVQPDTDVIRRPASPVSPSPTVRRLPTALQPPPDTHTALPPPAALPPPSTGATPTLPYDEAASGVVRRRICLPQADLLDDLALEANSLLPGEEYPPQRKHSVEEPPAVPLDTSDFDSDVESFVMDGMPPVVLPKVLRRPQTSQQPAAAPAVENYNAWAWRPYTKGRPAPAHTPSPGLSSAWGGLLDTAAPLPAPASPTGKALSPPGMVVPSKLAALLRRHPLADSDVLDATLSPKSPQHRPRLVPVEGSTLPDLSASLGLRVDTTTPRAASPPSASTPSSTLSPSRTPAGRPVSVSSSKPPSRRARSRPATSHGVTQFRGGMVQPHRNAEAGFPPLPAVTTLPDVGPWKYNEVRVAAPNTSVRLQGLFPGAVIRWQVVAMNDQGWGYASEWQALTVPQSVTLESAEASRLVVKCGAPVEAPPPEHRQTVETSQPPTAEATAAAAAAATLARPTPPADEPLPPLHVQVQAYVPDEAHGDMLDDREVGEEGTSPIARQPPAVGYGVGDGPGARWVDVALCSTAYVQGIDNLLPATRYRARFRRAMRVVPAGGVPPSGVSVSDSVTGGSMYVTPAAVAAAGSDSEPPPPGAVDSLGYDLHWPPWSASVPSRWFRTPDAPPDTPVRLRTEFRDSTSISMAWRPRRPNGGPTTGYRVEVAEYNPGRQLADDGSAVELPPVHDSLWADCTPDCTRLTRAPLYKWRVAGAVPPPPTADADSDADDPGAFGVRERWLLSNLRPGTTYVVRVRAVNRAGASPWTAMSPPVTTQALPPPQPEVPTIDVLSPHSVLLKWAIPPSREGTAVTRCRLMRKKVRRGGHPNEVSDSEEDDTPLDRPPIVRRVDDAADMASVFADFAGAAGIKKKTLVKRHALRWGAVVPTPPGFGYDTRGGAGAVNAWHSRTAAEEEDAVGSGIKKSVLGGTQPALLSVVEAVKDGVDDNAVLVAPVARRVHPKNGDGDTLGSGRLIKWRTNVHEDGAWVEAVVTGLYPGSINRFRVQYCNTVGWGQASEATNRGMQHPVVPLAPRNPIPVWPTHRMPDRPARHDRVGVVLMWQAPHGNGAPVLSFNLEAQRVRSAGVHYAESSDSEDGLDVEDVELKVETAGTRRRRYARLLAAGPGKPAEATTGFVEAVRAAMASMKAGEVVEEAVEDSESDEEVAASGWVGVGVVDPLLAGDAYAFERQREATPPASSEEEEEEEEEVVEVEEEDSTDSDESDDSDGSKEEEGSPPPPPRRKLFWFEADLTSEEEEEKPAKVVVKREHTPRPGDDFAAEKVCAWRLRDMLPGRRYRFRVHATNTVGDGPWSPVSPSIRTPALPPSAPPGRPCARPFKLGRVLVAFSVPRSNGSAITRYAFQVACLDAQDKRELAERPSSGALSKLAVGLAERRRAAYLRENLAWEWVLTDAPQPEAVRWKEGAAPDRPQHARTVLHAVDKGLMAALEGGRRWMEVLVPGLRPGEEYVARVRAENGAGWGRWSVPSARVTVPTRTDDDTEEEVEEESDDEDYDVF